MAQFMRELPCGLSDADKGSVSTAFSELLVNAIEHGGKLNSNEWVCVSRVRTKHTILYLIHDPGEGFSRPNLKHAAITNPEDPTAHVEVRERQKMRPGGFGMLMATRLVDEVIYNARGNEVILIKYLEPGTNA
jgi:anti-sigma regulatory factor (Ser/Thr protein kinase)